MTISTGTSIEPHLGEFLGHDMPDDQLDGLMAYAITKGDLETSRSLFASKWWDYRYVHPGRCYFLFAHLYGEAVERWRDRFGVNIYVKLKANGHPIYRPITTRKGFTETVTGKLELRPKAFITGLWRAMCFADAHGIPYDRFIQFAFEHAFDNQWQKLPLPTNLYGTWMVSRILERWDEEKKNLMRLPTDPRFTAQGYVGHSYQDQFQDWMIGLIAGRPNPMMALVQYLARERYVRLDKAVAKFGKDQVKQAMLRASR